MRPVWFTLTALMVIAATVLFLYGTAHWAWWPARILALIFLILGFMSGRGTAGELHPNK